MFSIFKKKYTANVDLSELATDMHSHLLPGIDDGSPDIETSLELIRGLQDLGYKQFITTPHIMWDLYKNEAATIQPALEQVQAAAPDVNIRFAAEYFMDDYFDELLQKPAPLLTVKDKWVLVEFSFITAPMNLKEKLFELQIKGYKPILAHPERYQYLLPRKQWYDELKEAGCYFQVNLLSLAGYYGKVPQELGMYLLKKDYIDLLGTDMHHVRHLNALRSSTNITPLVKSLLDAGRLLNPSI